MGDISSSKATRGEQLVHDGVTDTVWIHDTRKVICVVWVRDSLLFTEKTLEYLLHTVETVYFIPWGLVTVCSIPSRVDTYFTVPFRTKNYKCPVPIPVTFRALKW